MRIQRKVTAKKETNYKTTYERIPGTHLPRIPKGTRLAGREKGTPNKTTATVKEALMKAMEASGFDGKGKGGVVGYLTWLSRAEAVAFTTLIKSIIPLQLQAALNISTTNDPTEQLTIEELEKRMVERGLRPMLDITPPDSRPRQIEGRVEKP